LADLDFWKLLELLVDLDVTGAADMDVAGVKLKHKPHHP
jgi:hypothetical protein